LPRPHPFDLGWCSTQAINVSPRTFSRPTCRCRLNSFERTACIDLSAIYWRDGKRPRRLAAVRRSGHHPFLRRAPTKASFCRKKPLFIHFKTNRIPRFPPQGERPGPSRSLAANPMAREFGPLGIHVAQCRQSTAGIDGEKLTITSQQPQLSIERGAAAWTSEHRC